jgi:hypothetical protein
LSQPKFITGGTAAPGILEFGGAKGESILIFAAAGELWDFHTLANSP